jgi:hypothetical protein
MNTAQERVTVIQQRFPKEGLFADKEWNIGPEPFFIEPALADYLERLGHWLFKFVRAANLLYQQSRRGKKPAWIAEYLDAGKPAVLRDLWTTARADLPRVIRPDIILTQDGMIISELDSVPGGIGLTGWLNQVYADLGFDVIGGRNGMVEGFHSILPHGGTIAVSEEASTYRPEMRWLQRELNAQFGPHWDVQPAETWDFRSGKPVYRFFELFDLPNLPSAKSLLEAARAGTLQITPPLKPYLEEKLWFALFWSHPLQEFWIRELSERHFRKLQSMMPKTWVVDPAPVPHHAVIPWLCIQQWDELKHFSHKQREFVLKISGFSERAWGSRGVYVGTDLPQAEWARLIDEAKASFPTQPFILQRFHRGRLFEQSMYQAATGTFSTSRGRVRLCPYYFVASEDDIRLGGVLATIVPADKKIVHGMRDAVMVPVAVKPAT